MSEWVSNWIIWQWVYKMKRARASGNCMARQGNDDYDGGNLPFIDFEWKQNVHLDQFTDCYCCCWVAADCSCIDIFNELLFCFISFFCCAYQLRFSFCHNWFAAFLVRAVVIVFSLPFFFFCSFVCCWAAAIVLFFSFIHTSHHFFDSIRNYWFSPGLT